MTRAITAREAAQHTPGPWRDEKSYSTDGEPGQRVIMGNDPVYGPCRLADVYDEADARLIAAAPDMLAALESFVEQWTKLAGFPECSTPYSGPIVAARAAIAKAQGVTR